MHSLARDPMVMAGAEAPYVPEEPSPWWLKGLAIFMALMVVFMLFNTASGILSPMIVDRFMPENFDDIEPYPEDGTEEEKAEWDRSNAEWDVLMEYMDDMMGVLEFSAVHSGLLALMGLFCIPVLWRGDRELGVKLVGAWIGVNFLGGMGMMWMMSRIGFMPEFDYGPEAEAVDLEFFETISLIAGWGQIIICNICFLGILGLVASKSKPATSFDIPSGFRPNDSPQS
ncbi:uncharacterized protein METZ01_LOCUS395343 [marine metagenome]|uniref:Uncharacterized protein n=1 Tax=marine metagenome TaxID=408172 RepID=A0A382V7L3_9ZZZZ